jgi:serine/threonine protein kinase
MYEAATGRVPFSGNNYLSVISQVLNEEPKRLRLVRPELSEEFESIVGRAMAKNRDDRYPDAQAMLRDLNLLLDDPTHSTERAKITGPRRLLPRPRIPRITWAIMGISLAVAGAAVVIMFLMGGKAKPAKQAQVAAVDAGAQAARPEGSASPPTTPPPVVETIKLHIITTPPNAIVWRDSEQVGPSPTDIELVKTNKDVKITAQLDGYDDATTIVNPFERTSGDIKLKLNKAHGPAKPKVPPKGLGTGTGTGPVNHTGGELSPNPYAGSGTVPKK